MSTEPKPLYPIFTALALYSSWIVPCIYFPSHRPSPLTLKNERACVLRLLQLLCMAPSSPRSIYCQALSDLNSVCNCPTPFCQHTEVRIYTRMRQKVETKPWVRKDPFAMFSPTFGHYPNGLGLNIKKGSFLRRDWITDCLILTQCAKRLCFAVWVQSCLADSGCNALRCADGIAGQTGRRKDLYINTGLVVTVTLLSYEGSWGRQ